MLTDEPDILHTPAIVDAVLHHRYPFDARVPANPATIKVNQRLRVVLVVERSFTWLSCYRRLNTIFERSKEHLIAFVEIAFISILARRLKRLIVEQLSA